MKKYFLIILIALISINSIADVTIIAMPSKAWLRRYKYGSFEKMPNGRERFNPDYKMAFEDTQHNLTAVLRDLSKPFEEFYKVEDLATALENVNEDEALFEEYGTDIDMSEMIALSVKPDVKLEIQYIEDTEARLGPRTRYNVEISALDAYTNDIIATFNGVTDLGTSPVHVQVGRLAANNMQKILGEVNEAFEIIEKYGRECCVTCLTKGYSFNSDQIEGQIMKYYIRDVLKSIANEGRSTNKRDTDKMQDYRIRIPVNEKVENLGETLQNKFASAGIPVRIDKKGLGKFVIIFGE